MRRHDEHRGPYEGLRRDLQRLFRTLPPERRPAPVTPEHLALYLAWLALAYDAARSLDSTYAGPAAPESLTYEQLEQRFRWLERNIADPCSDAALAWAGRAGGRAGHAPADG